ncbi:MAG: hypothetical protein A2Y73_05585 [Chloroflexi bacterium RBG_13_56_8]|nr:MAG: hypothetical protein A2Y73_05585 [Chloroflexi bacterium RBG_13_56_8]
MNLLKKGRLYLPLFIAALLALTGCAPRGATTNQGWTVVAATDGAVYAVLPAGRVIALDAATGDELWSYPIGTEQGGIGCSFARTNDENTAKPLNAVYGAPTIHGDLVLITSYDHNLYAFDRATGDKRWTFAANDAVIGSATLFDGIIYFGASDHNVYAVDAATGESVWEAAAQAGHWVWGAPAVNETRVFVGSMDHHVYAFDRQTGKEVWNQDVGASVPGSVTLADGMLLVGAIDKELHALDAETGDELWRRFMGGWVWGDVWVDDGYVYAGSLDGTVHALNLSDGSPRWEAVPVNGAVRAGPVLIGNTLIAATEKGTIYQINTETGEEQVLFETGSAVLSELAPLGNMVCLGTNQGNIFELDASNALEPLVWVYPLQEN